MKLAKYVIKKLKRMAINMFRLFLGIAAQKLIAAPKFSILDGKLSTRQPVT